MDAFFFYFQQAIIERNSLTWRGEWTSAMLEWLDTMHPLRKFVEECAADQERAISHRSCFTEEVTLLFCSTEDIPKPSALQRMCFGSWLTMGNSPYPCVSWTLPHHPTPLWVSLGLPTQLFFIVHPSPFLCGKHCCPLALERNFPPF